MVKSFKKYLLPLLFLTFSALLITAFIQGKPSSKNKRVYTAVQEFSPYYLEKRFGGLQIMNKEDKEFKEKPTNATLFKEFERLEKEWAKTHLKVKKDMLIILDNSGKELSQLPLHTTDEINFVHTYYEI
jgi:hypothetical protein